MRVWYDACTGKHVRYGAAIAKRLREKGHEVILTTRRHPDTVNLAALLGENFVAVGRYDPRSPMTRLKESLKRQLRFCKMFEKAVPDVAISHRSVELCRVAFGLGIPNISTHDTVHAEAVNRLTMPLINFLVVSKALPESSVDCYGIRKIFWFDGVDEVAWIKGFKPEVKHDYAKPLIVVRQLEERAAYAKGKSDWTKALAKKLTSMGNVLFLPRYQKRPIKGLTVPEEFVDSASLVSQADLVISAGGTIAREAALQGVPSIVVESFEKLYVNDYLAAKGFPIFTVKNPSDALSCARKLMGKRWNVKELLDKLENPVDVIENIIEKEIE
ncbi:MAG: DUF354 domain-containing protein [Candidatus Bathyarchaeota archaeon]|nr:DUF354 domain-containing protein [Candidatus Bathyarchaeota archaeon]